MTLVQKTRKWRDGLFQLRPRVDGDGERETELEQSKVWVSDTSVGVREPGHDMQRVIFRHSRMFQVLNSARVLSIPAELFFLYF